MKKQEPAVMEDWQSADAELFRATFTHFLDQFISPAVRRRQELGELPRPLDLRQAQVVFYPDGRNTDIRVNDEVKGTLMVKLKEGIEKAAGEPYTDSEIERSTGFVLDAADDPDCGHMTFIRVGRRWFGSFDFIYYKGLAERHLHRGREFLGTAEHALAEGHLGACFDNLYSAAELFAKGHLLLLSELQLRTSKKHTHVGTRYNYHGKIGNVEGSHRDALNELFELRAAARYLSKEDPRINESVAQRLRDEVRGMAAAIDRLRGKRS
jgi:hypothetical protein